MTPIDVPTISITPDTCGRDGLCVHICPMRVFTNNPGACPDVRRVEECILCGHCVSACPRHAILHSGFPAERLAPISYAGVASPEAAFALLSQRRSVREYRPDPLPKELLREIIDVAGYAPGSPFHRVGWTRQFTVVVGEANMRKVSELTALYVRRIRKLVTGPMVRFSARFSDSARAALDIVPDLTMRLGEWSEGRDVITYRAPAAIFAHAPQRSSTPQADCDAALYSIMLLAHARGLGTCWNGFLQGAAAGDHLRGFSALRNFLKIPPGNRCYAAATVGYPALKLHSSPRRDVAVEWIEP